MFELPRLLRGDPPALSPHSVGWTVEYAIAQVDAAGRVREVTSSGDSILGRVLAAWIFRPARDARGPVASRVLIAAVFRPPVFPDVGPPPDLVQLAAGLDPGVPRPISSAAPGYPPGRVGRVVAIVEVLVDSSGGVERVGIIGAKSGFDDAALAAAREWRFKPALRAGKPVPASVYLLFGFREPVAVRRR